jgi:hypothetical protein
MAPRYAMMLKHTDDHSSRGIPAIGAPGRGSIGTPRDHSVTVGDPARESGRAAGAARKGPPSDV